MVSVSIEFDIGGIEEFRAKMMRLDEAMRMRVWEKLQQIGTHIKVEAQRLSPVKTGFLRSTIYASMDPPSPMGMTEKQWILKVGAWADYAKFQEFGTRYIEPREFLTKSLEMHLPQLAEVVVEALRLAAEEASR